VQFVFIRQEGVWTHNRKAVVASRRMAPTEHVTDEQFERHTLEALLREPDGFAGYLRLNRFGKGDYTRDRIEWQKNLTVSDVVAS